jgi:hypothetical protein
MKKATKRPYNKKEKISDNISNTVSLALNQVQMTRDIKSLEAARAILDSALQEIAHSINNSFLDVVRKQKTTEQHLIDLDARCADLEKKITVSSISATDITN